MRFALMIEAQQGLSYEDQLAIVRRAEAAGFEIVLPERPLRRVPGRRAIARRPTPGPSSPASPARRRGSPSAPWSAR